MGQNSRAGDQCYVCGGSATSREHVPPNSLFPKGHRDHLITVPSCDTHNIGKQKDDGYLRAILTANLTTNAVGLEHGRGPVLRAHKRKPAMLVDMFSRATPVELSLPDGQTASTAAIELDQERITGVIKQIARGIYFHHFGRPAPSRAETLMAFLVAKGPEAQKIVFQLTALAAEVFGDSPPLGDNPDVFTYRVAEGETSVGIELTFYGNNVAFVAFQEPPAASGAEPAEGA